MSIIRVPTVPEYITVHLGRPQVEARNVTVTFQEYIRNVACSEVYPTWPESCLYANLLCQVSFALNRVYTEWYRSRGYGFDITNSTYYDMAYVHGRDIFTNVADLCDQAFNHYIRRVGYVEPLAASFCNGTTATCAGLSQWGSLSLAQSGLSALEIVQYYYGDVEIVYDAPVAPYVQSYPGYPLQLGDYGIPVAEVQYKLNRIALNYPLIPVLDAVDGIFGSQTQAAVQTFQRIFSLTADGIVGKQTWNKLQEVFVAVKKLAELESEGITNPPSGQYPGALGPGDTGEAVDTLQVYLNTEGDVNEFIQPTLANGRYDRGTQDAVTDYQLDYNLPATGQVDRATWDSIARSYAGTQRTLQALQPVLPQFNYPGVLQLGQSGPAIGQLQRFLLAARAVYPTLPVLEPTGVFDAPTAQALLAFKTVFGLPADARLDANTWEELVNLYEGLTASQYAQAQSFPGLLPGQPVDGQEVDSRVE